MGFQWNLLQQCYLLHYKMFLLLCNLKPTPESKNMFLNFLHWNIYLDIVYENTSPLRMCNEAKFICANKNSANIFQEKIFLWNVCRFLLWYVFYRNSHDDLYNAFMIFSWNLVLPISWMLFLTSDSIHINLLFCYIWMTRVSKENKLHH